MTMEVEEMAGNVELRTALHVAVNQERPGALYRADIERLRSQFGHNITVLAHDYSAYWRGVPEPTCYGFAFGLANNAQYLEQVRAGRFGSEDVTTLLRARGPTIFRQRRAAPRDGDVVLYFCDEKVRHAGIIIGAPGRIRSKWGPAEVHEHDLWEVPLNYGHVAEIFLPPSPTRILALLAA
jgi:hypothetical protein